MKAALVIFHPQRQPHTQSQGKDIVILCKIVEEVPLRLEFPHRLGVHDEQEHTSEQPVLLLQFISILTPLNQKMQHSVIVTAYALKFKIAGLEINIFQKSLQKEQGILEAVFMNGIDGLIEYLRKRFRVHHHWLKN